MFSDFIDIFKTRLSSPILMSIFVSFVLINWQAFYYLFFSGAPAISSIDNWWIKSKFAYWHEYMVWWRYLIPIPFGLAYVWLAPKLSLWGAKLTSNDVNAKRMLEKEEASKVLELETQLQNTRNAAVTAAIEEAENKQRIKSILDQETRENLEADIEELEKIGFGREAPELAKDSEQLISQVNDHTKVASDESSNSIVAKEVKISPKTDVQEIGHSSAHEFEINLRYKKLIVGQNEGYLIPKEIYAQVKDLRTLEGNVSDPFAINKRVDELWAMGSKIARRRDELHAIDTQDIMLEEMEKKYDSIAFEILNLYSDISLPDDDTPF